MVVLGRTMVSYERGTPVESGHSPPGAGLLLLLYYSQA